MKTGSPGRRKDVAATGDGTAVPGEIVNKSAGRRAGCCFANAGGRAASRGIAGPNDMAATCPNVNYFS